MASVQTLLLYLQQEDADENTSFRIYVQQKYIQR